jgi:shikimate dehydrogenase
MDASAEAIGSVNTIVNTGGQLRAYNTDYLAIAKLLATTRSRWTTPSPCSAAGYGQGCGGGAARHEVPRGCRGGAQRPDGDGPGRPVRLCLAGRAWPSRPQLLVNATPVGMSGGPAADDLPVAPEVVDSAETVFDVVALSALTPLVRRARVQGKQVITGPEVIALQALEQFVLYTGVRPSDDQVRRASEFSRA